MTALDIELIMIRHINMKNPSKFKSDSLRTKKKTTTVITTAITTKKGKEKPFVYTILERFILFIYCVNTNSKNVPSTQTTFS